MAAWSLAGYVVGVHLEKEHLEVITCYQDPCRNLHLMKSSAKSDRCVCSSILNNSINNMQSRANHKMGGILVRDNCLLDDGDQHGDGGIWDDNYFLILPTIDP